MTRLERIKARRTRLKKQKICGEGKKKGTASDSRFEPLPFLYGSWVFKSQKLNVNCSDTSA